MGKNKAQGQQPNAGPAQETTPGQPAQQNQPAKPKKQQRPKTSNQAGAANPEERKAPARKQPEERKAAKQQPQAAQEPAQNDGWGAMMGQAKANQGKPIAAAPKDKFPSRPVQSANADRGPPASRGGGGDRGGRGGRGGGGGGRGGRGAGAPRPKVPLTSNHFRLNLGFQNIVYQYALRILPDDIFDASRVHDILRTKHRRIYKILGTYAPSGQMIFTMQPIAEDVNEETVYQGAPCQIIIEKATETQTLLDANFINSQNSVCQAIFNVVVKNAFRQTHLKQIGRDPKFFDYERPIVDERLTQMQLQILRGYKASVFMSEVGLTICVDTLFRFMSTITCLDKINQLKREAYNDADFMNRINTEVVGSSIIADWGHKRTYIIDGVNFKSTPTKQKFEHNGSMTSVAQYMHDVYQKDITDLNQPLIIVKHGDDQIHLPPEFCRIDGVPDQIKASPGMRDCLAMCRVQPHEKMTQVQQCISMLMQTQSLRDWDMAIESNAIDLANQTVLTAPMIFEQNQVIHVDENVLRNLPIQDVVNLGHEEWIMVYQHGGRGRSNYNAANNVFNGFQAACGKLGMTVEEPYFIEIENEADMNAMENELQTYIMPKPGKFRFPKMLVMIIGNESLYDKHKQLYKQYQIPSQCVVAKKVGGPKGCNLSVASNILKQINSKCGGNLYFMKFPEKMKNSRTMLIGIDVCHSGGQSIVGFAASSNKEMSQYFSDFIVQKKGQEVINTQLKDCLKKAIEHFSKGHDGKNPTDIIIFRDGVSGAERDQVVDREVSQFIDACKSIYNQAATQPKISLVIVNKRIMQSFFQKGSNGRLENPPSGCIVDKDLVECSGNNKNEFDFFMFPMKGTQGCQKPTHFHVPINQTNLTKLELQQLIYGLCHYYFNWAGPIKVPAPCMYAHKIADLFTRIGFSKKARAFKNVQIQDHITSSQRPLEEKLFFL